jgi:hypothetical protein
MGERTQTNTVTQSAQRRAGDGGGDFARYAPKIATTAGWRVTRLPRRLSLETVT